MPNNLLKNFNIMPFTSDIIKIIRPTININIKKFCVVVAIYVIAFLALPSFWQ
jgi:hypothetical protein